MDITKIIEVIITVAIVVIARFLVPWLKTKMTAEQIATLKTVVDATVWAIEQVRGNELTGKAKKSAVVQEITNFCAEHKINISYNQISDLIEAAVKQMHIEEERANGNS